jgi:hypothetical protein
LNVVKPALFNWVLQKLCRQTSLVQLGSSKINQESFLKETEVKKLSQKSNCRNS